MKTVTKEFEQRLPELRFVGCLAGNLRVRTRITCVLSYKKQVILLQCGCNILGIKKIWVWLAACKASRMFFKWMRVVSTVKILLSQWEAITFIFYILWNSNLRLSFLLNRSFFFKIYYSRELKFITLSKVAGINTLFI